MLVLLLFTVHYSLSTAFPQQPQAQAGQELYPVNAKYVQGFGPGYWPTAGANLILSLAPGTAVCSSVVRTYAGGTLTLAPNATNYVYLDTTNNCVPASNTTGFTSVTIPIATVATSGSAITSVTDVRTMFVSSPSSGNASGLGNGSTVIDASMKTGTDWSVHVNAAIAACPSAGCTVDARGFASPQTMSESITLFTSANGPVTLLLPTGSIVRANGAQFLLGNYSRVLGQGQGEGQTLIHNENADTTTVFANGTGGTLSGAELSDFKVVSEGNVSIKDASGNAQTAWYATGTCFDFSSALSNRMTFVSGDCQVALKVSNSAFNGAYYNDFFYDTFQSLNPDGVSVLFGEFPNSNRFYDCTFSTWGSAVFFQSAGGWVTFYGGDIEGAGAGIVVYQGQAVHIQDVYFESIGARNTPPIWAVWQANWPYVQGATVLDTNNHTQVCVTAGTSGSSAPSWNATYGGTTADNGAVWMTLQGAQVVFGPNATGNIVDGAYGPTSIDNYSTALGGTSNLQSLPPTGAGTAGLVPLNYTAGQFSLGNSYGSGTSSSNSYTMDYDPANAFSGVRFHYTGGLGGTYGRYGLGPVSAGGFTSIGGTGTVLENQLSMVGLPNPGAPTVTLYGSHPGSGSTVTYAEVAHCGGGVTMPGTPTAVQTNIPSVPGALISASIVHGGSGYQVGDTPSVIGAGSPAFSSGGVYTVDTVNGSGAVLTGHISTAGYGYPDGYNWFGPSFGAQTSGGHGTGLSLSLVAYDLVEISAPPGGSDAWSGCLFDLLKDTTGAGLTNYSIATNQALNLGVPFFQDTLLDYGQSKASYSPPSRNTTADATLGGNASFTGPGATFGAGQNANFGLDTNGSGSSLTIGYNSAKGGQGWPVFSIYNNATDRNLMFGVTSKGSYGTGANTVFTLNNVLDDGAGNMTAANKMTAQQFCISSNCVTSLWSNPMTTLGDFLYGGAGGAATRLAGNTSTTPMYLKSVGASGAATAPTLAQVQFSDIAGTVGISAGGTGQTTAAAAFNALSPLSTEGDLLYYHSSANTRLGVGANGLCLTSNGTAPVWGSCSSGGLSNPMTTLGDLIYGAASGAPTRLGGNASSTKNFLTSTGTGSAANSPAWGTIASTDLPSTITSNTSGNAATATALAASPTTCTSGKQYALGIAANGNASCNSVGFVARSVTGTTDTIVPGDLFNGVNYTGSGNVTVTLPTATTLGVTNFATTFVNATSGSSTTVTVSATSWQIYLNGGSSGSSSLTVAQGESCFLFVDPSGSAWDANCHAPQLTAGTNITFTRSAAGLSIASSGGGSMIYPGAGLPISTGSAWGTSLTESDGHIVAGVSGAWAVAATLPSAAFPALSGDVTNTAGSLTTAVGKVNGVTYGSSPSTNTVPVVTGSGATTYEAVPNAALANSAITLNGTANQITSPGSTALGGTATFSIANPFAFPGKATLAASTTSAASLNVPSGSAPSSPSSGDEWNLSGIRQFYDGSHTNSFTTIQTAPTSGHLAAFSGTSGLLTDGGAVPSGTVTSVSGDGTVTNGTVTSSGSLGLANAGAGTVLNNTTTSAAAPSYTVAPVLGKDNTTAGTLQLANGSAAAHTIFSSAATTTNTIAGFTTVPTNGHLVTCTVSSTTCTLTDGGAVPSGTVTSISADGTVETGTVTTTGSFSLATAGAGTLLSNSTGAAAAPSYTATPTLGKAGTTLGTISLCPATGSYCTTLKPTNSTGSGTVFAFPTGNGSNTNVLTTDGAGNTSWSAASGGGVSYGAGGGSADAQTVTVSPAITSQPAGTAIIVLPGYANATSTPTMAANGLSAMTITKCGTRALLAKDLSTSADAFLISDGTHWQLQNPQIAGCGHTAAYAIGSAGSSQTISPANGLYQTMTLSSGTCTVSFTQPTSGVVSLTLVVTQAAGGSDTITWSSVRWPGGIAPVMSSGASAIDIYSFKLDGTNVYGMAGQNFQ